MVVDTVATCPELFGVFTLPPYPVEFTLERTDGGWWWVELVGDVDVGVLAIVGLWDGIGIPFGIPSIEGGCEMMGDGWSRWLLPTEGMRGDCWKLFKDCWLGVSGCWCWDWPSCCDCDCCWPGGCGWPGCCWCIIFGNWGMTNIGWFDKWGGPVLAFCCW